MRDELAEELDWFADNLLAPEDHYFTRRYGNIAICWFCEDAITLIQRTWRIASILRAADIIVTVARTRNPGMIVYMDEHQVIARPAKSTPTKWG